MGTEKIKGSIMLFFAAFVWGIAFVAQSAGMEFVGPFTFNGIRCALGGIVLIPCIFVLNHMMPERKQKKEKKRDLLLGGFFCGCALFAASSLQQIGLQYTTVGKAGFLTTLYIVIVPIFGIFLKKKVEGRVWMSVIFAVIGFYFLCLSETFYLAKGDIFELAGAAIFAIHILLIDYFSPKADGVKLSCIQFFVCAILSAFFLFFVEKPTLSAVWEARLPIAYAGILSCGVAYTLQVIGQKNLAPAVASLILSLESVIALFSGIFLLKQKVSLREGIGCILVFAAVLLVELPRKQTTKKAKENLLV